MVALMAQADDQTPRPELGRWAVLALLILAGIVLFFVFAPGTHPAVTPTGTGIGP